MKPISNALLRRVDFWNTFPLREYRPTVEPVENVKKEEL